ncbi:MAG: hypothetical protein ACRCX2_37140 [Paraclostridium sp.]
MIKSRIVKIQNYEELIELLKYADKMGNKWYGGESLLFSKIRIDAYSSYKDKDLCIMFDTKGRASYSPYGFYKENRDSYNYEFFDVSDIIINKKAEFEF